jgi:hypothetical protein
LLSELIEIYRSFRTHGTARKWGPIARSSYKDVRLLVVRNPGSGEQEGLAIKVIIAHYKKHKKQ